MAIATALGWGNVAQLVLAIALAYLFGFSLTAYPLVRAALPAGTIVSTALAADTLSITIMEAIDNLTVLLVPGAMSAGLKDPLFYGSIAAGFAIASPFAFAANRDCPRQGPRACSRPPLTLVERRPVATDQALVTRFATGRA